MIELVGLLWNAVGFAVNTTLGLVGLGTVGFVGFRRAGIFRDLGVPDITYRDFMGQVLAAGLVFFALYVLVVFVSLAGPAEGVAR